MARLEVLHTIHYWAGIGSRMLRNRNSRGNVTQELQTLHQLAHVLVRLPWRDWLVHLRQGFGYFFARHLQIFLQCRQRSLVTRIWRFDLRQHGLGVRRVHYVFPEKLAGIMLLAV